MSCAYGTVTRSGAPFQGASALVRRSHDADPTTPAGVPAGLGWSPFARRYWGSRVLLSVPPGTEMFQFPGLWRGSRDRRSLSSSPGLFAAVHARTFGWRLGIPPVPLGA